MIYDEGKANPPKRAGSALNQRMTAEGQCGSEKSEVKNKDQIPNGMWSFIGSQNVNTQSLINTPVVYTVVCTLSLVD